MDPRIGERGRDKRLTADEMRHRMDESGTTPYYPRRLDALRRGEVIAVPPDVRIAQMQRDGIERLQKRGSAVGGEDRDARGDFGGGRRASSRVYPGFCRSSAS